MAVFSSPLLQSFQELTDPRHDMNKKHFLLDIIAITIIGVIAGFEGWEDIEMFAQAREKWLREFLRLPNGIPLTILFAGLLCCYTLKNLGNACIIG
ncbi:hypothetical protein MASR1M12_27560 [Erysipelotrichia bacterium]